MLNTVRGLGTDINTADILHVYGIHEKPMTTVLQRTVISHYVLKWLLMLIICG